MTAMSLSKPPAPSPATPLPDGGVLVLDLSGLKCPLPALRTRKALKALVSGARLSVICTDPMAAIDIPHLLNQTGDTLTDRHEAEGTLTFEIRRC
jgi:tRNA 2-thiouridine synthesizing protein A